jgi:hypothetical protein
MKSSIDPLKSLRISQIVMKRLAYRSIFKFVFGVGESKKRVEKHSVFMKVLTELGSHTTPAHASGYVSPLMHFHVKFFRGKISSVKLKLLYFYPRFLFLQNIQYSSA